MISIVSPVYNSENCLDELVKKIISSTKILSIKIEIILIDDGSDDGSWNKIIDLKKRFDFIKGIKLNKNYGQHEAIYCGIKYSSGDIMVIMDCDLQDNPEFIPEMYRKYQEMKKPVIVQHSYADFSIRDRLISNIFWYFLIIISFKKFSPYLGNFLLIDKSIKEKYLLTSNIGYLYGDLIDQDNEFFFIKKKRSKGVRQKTTYDIYKLFTLAVKLIKKFNIISKLLKKNIKIEKKNIEIEVII